MKFAWRARTRVVQTKLSLFIDQFEWFVELVVRPIIIVWPFQWFHQCIAFLSFFSPHRAHQFSPSSLCSSFSIDFIVYFWFIVFFSLHFFLFEKSRIIEEDNGIHLKLNGWIAISVYIETKSILQFAFARLWIKYLNKKKKRPRDEIIDGIQSTEENVERKKKLSHERNLVSNEFIIKLERINEMRKYFKNRTSIA